MAVDDRDSHIIEDFKDGATDIELASKYGLSRQHVMRIRKRNGVTAKSRRVPVHPKTTFRKPISNGHRKLGIIVSEKRVLESGQGYEAFAKKLGLSRDRLLAIERGVCDLTFTDIQKISECLDIKLSELFEGV